MDFRCGKSLEIFLPALSIALEKGLSVAGNDSI
jgi:hypothetical protein